MARYIGEDKKEKSRRARALAGLAWDARYKPAKQSDLSAEEKSTIEAVNSVWKVAEEAWLEASASYEETPS